MEKCNKYILLDYVLDKLTREEETAVQYHLSVCEDCRRRVEGIRTLRAGMSEGRIEKVKVKVVSWKFLKYPLVACVLLGLVLGSLELRRGRGGVDIQDALHQNVLSSDSLSFRDSSDKGETARYKREKKSESDTLTFDNVPEETLNLEF